MKTIGERIRQAREDRQMSGYELAMKVGYKHQSAIGNLENRAIGNGGNRIAEIAEALRVPLEWLMKGPDSDTVPYRPPIDADLGDTKFSLNDLVVQQPSIVRPMTTALRTGPFDPWTLEAIEILSRLKDHEKQGALANLRTFVHNLGPPFDGHPVSMAG